MVNHDKKQAKKTTSFRLDPKTLDKISKFAKDDDISLNTLINKVLKDYVGWERNAKKVGWIFIKKEVLKLFLENLDKKMLPRLALAAAKLGMKDTLLAMSGRVDIDSWLSVAKQRSEKSNFAYRENKKDDEIELVITHNMGLRWSIFHKWYYTQMLRDIGCYATSDYTENTLVLKIKTK